MGNLLDAFFIRTSFSSSIGRVNLYLNFQTLKYGGAGMLSNQSHAVSQ